MKSLYKTIIISISMFSILMCSSMIAYYSDTDTQTNNLSIGINTTDIEETYEPPETLTPGMEFAKNPTVKCTEGADCFVRVYCEFSNSNADLFSTLDINTTDWVKESDGFYYYKNKLSAGESTTPLFTKVKINDDATDKAINALNDLDLIVYSESVQAMNAETGNYYSDYTSAWAYWNTEKEGIIS